LDWTLFSLAENEHRSTSFSDAPALAHGSPGAENK
jgi:hypothetical protein